MLSMTNTLTATLRTSQGTVQVRLFPDHAPKTVANFVELAEGSRDWTDPRTRQFGDEIHPDLRFDRPYLLAMANAGPGTNGSQFFITTVPTPHLTGKHTIFGEVIDGSDVIERISQARTGRSDRPVQDVVLESVTIERPSGNGETAG
jgi:peptidyl-prolyl cis-trans isomerase A (cyclophilin A)